MKRLLSVVLLCISFYGFAQRKPITHETMWMMKRIGAPEVSPNGKWVVFSVTEPAYDEKEVVNDLWITSADGSTAPRKLTGNKGGEGGYKWSPDSKRIAFTAKRDADEASQVYLLNVAEGGEAQRLTNLSTGASSPQWSPDGRMIAFTSKVYPGAFTDSANKKIADERKKQKYKARVYTSYPIRSWDQWLDDKQTHIFVQPVDGSSTAKDLFAGASGLLKYSGFNTDGSLAWAPDNSSIVFVATTEFDKAVQRDVVSNLYSVSISGGEPKQLTTDGADYGTPKFSPDGRSLVAFSSAANNYKVYNLNKLARFDWPSMQNKTLLTPALDRPVSDYEIVSNQLFFVAEDQGQDKAYAVALQGGVPQRIANNDRGCFGGISVSADGSLVVSTYEDASTPPEVVRIQPAASSYTFLSQFNKEKLAQLEMVPVETFWTKSSRGKQIRSLLVKPAGFDASKKYPLFVLMHGGPAGSWKDNWGYRWNYHLLAQPGYVMVLTDYTGSTGYGEKFSQDIQFDPFRGPANEIQEAAADAIKRYAFIDGTRQAAGGASYGGHLANWLEATTTHYKCLISHAGLVNSEAQYGTSDGNYGREVMAGGAPWTQTKTWKEQNPIRMAANFKTPMLVTVGELDYRVPLNNSLENWAALQRQNVPSKLVIFPEENHWILKPENSRFFYQEVHSWLKQYLNP